MSQAKTLLELAGADLTPPRLADSCLVLIDLQNEYLTGPIALPTNSNPALNPPDRRVPISCRGPS